MSREGVDAQPDPGDTRRTAGPVVASQPSILNSEKISPPVPPIENDQRRDATDEETKTLRHVNDRIPAAAWIVILAGAAERATYFGIIAPWQNYMQNARESNGTPGALGLGQSMATNISNAFFLFSFLTPMPFALLSDIYIGRFKSLLAGLAYAKTAHQLDGYSRG
ncbi:MAG: hypothetical protein L6R39_003405 [Caloplaca ligustica]|nr:MAG: hypothetical protein L6R39_003405 [Caloplaca ligustica]